MSSITCEFCFSQFTGSAQPDTRTVQCPDCGEETSALPDDAIDSATYSVTGSDAEEDLAESEESESESYGFSTSDDEFGALEVTGEVISDDDAPAVVPARRRKKRKSGKRKKKKKAPAESGTNAIGQMVSSIVDILSGYPKVIVGVLVWIVFMVCYQSGVFESREQEVFHNLTGEGRTTGEWLTVVRNYEEQSADGEISMKAKSLYMRISRKMSTFLGADPAAIPDLFTALQEDPERSRLPELAETVLGKFRKTNKKPLISDLEDGLESGHPKVILWSIRLLAIHRSEASGSADAVAEFVNSDDQEIAGAASETLSQIR